LMNAACDLGFLLGCTTRSKDNRKITTANH
jgi:hypothetical protein